MLDGTLTATGGQVKLHDLNGTIADTQVTFGPPFYLPQFPVEYFFRNMTMVAGGTTYRGRALFDNVVPPFFCYRLQWFSPVSAGSQLGAELLRGPAASPPPPPPAGECIIYPTATKVGPSSEPGIVSGGPVVEPASAIKLFPSWPASSPWVTVSHAALESAPMLDGQY